MVILAIAKEGLFVFSVKQKIEVSLGQAITRNSPPDCCIESFKTLFIKKKKTAEWWSLLFGGEGGICLHFAWAK